MRRYLISVILFALGDVVQMSPDVSMHFYLDCSNQVAPLSY